MVDSVFGLVCFVATRFDGSGGFARLGLRGGAVRRHRPGSTTSPQVSPLRAIDATEMDVFRHLAFGGNIGLDRLQARRYDLQGPLMPLRWICEDCLLSGRERVD